MNIVCAFEERLDVSIPTRDVWKLRQVSDVIAYMEQHEMMPLSSSAALSLGATILMTSFGTWGLPQMVHKYYGIRNDKEVRRGTVISTLFALLVSGGGYFIGSFSHLFFGSEMPEGGKDYIVPQMLNMAGLPNILIGYISTINKDTNNLTKSGYLTPVVDFEHLEEVLVITDLK